MTVYVDELREWSSGIWCHMTADALDELHEMAGRIGMKRRWFQAKASTPHYDLRPTKRKLALEAGATFVPAREQARKRIEARRSEPKQQKIF